MARRWNCPLCASGINAPERLVRDDVRRYCLPCSVTSGKLVRREMPAQLRKKEARAEARKARNQEARERRRTEREQAATTYPGVLHTYFERWSRLKAWGADMKGLSLTIRRRAGLYSTGHAYWARNAIVVTVGTCLAEGYEVLLHELAHHAGWRRPGGLRFKHHETAFWACLLHAAEEVLGRSIPLEGVADRRVDTAVVAAFTEEVAAGRLPGVAAPLKRATSTPGTWAGRAREARAAAVAPPAPPAAPPSQ